MLKYLGKKLVIYALTFFTAVTLNWGILRFLPGDPISRQIARYSRSQETMERMRAYYTESFGLDKPVLEQYFSFWGKFLKGDLGISILHSPQPVLTVIGNALPYTLAVLLPGILLAWFLGNRFGAFAARKKFLDNWILPLSYLFMSAPYFWFGIALVWFLGIKLNLFPLAFAYAKHMVPGWNFPFIIDFIWHWTLPCLSLFLVSFGSWAIGMRNMVIYELESNYSRFMESLGAKDSLVRSYAYKNAILPQVTGLALQMGTLVTGNVLLETVFSYPGVGFVLFRAVTGLDYFLIQGGFLTLILIVLAANFIVDLVYILVDPRIRRSYQGAL